MHQRSWSFQHRCDNVDVQEPTLQPLQHESSSNTTQVGVGPISKINTNSLQPCALHPELKFADPVHPTHPPNSTTTLHHICTQYVVMSTFTLAFKKLKLLSLVLLSLAFEDPNRWSPLHGALHAMLHSGGAHPWHCCVKTTDLKLPQIKCKNKCRGWQKKISSSLSVLSVLCKRKRSRKIPKQELWYVRNCNACFKSKRTKTYNINTTGTKASNVLDVTLIHPEKPYNFEKRKTNDKCLTGAPLQVLGLQAFATVSFPVMSKGTSNSLLECDWLLEYHGCLEPRFKGVPMLESTNTTISLRQ